MGDPEQIGQAKGPVVDEFGRIEQVEDQVVPLVRIPAVQKLPHPPWWGKGSRQVQADPPQKLLVTGAFRGKDAEAAQLSPDLFVDEVPGDLTGKFGQDAAHHPQGDTGCQARRLHQDGGLARLQGPDQAFFVHLDHLVGGGLVAHPAGEILSAAIGEPGGDHQLLAQLRLQHDLGGALLPGGGFRGRRFHRALPDRSN